MHLEVRLRAVPLLLGSVSGSLLASWALLHSLHPEERVSILHGVCLISLGFIFFISLFDLSNYFFLHSTKGKQLVKRYKLSLYDIYDISNKFVSGVQAVLSCLTGAVVCTYSCSRNFLRTSHFMSDAYAWFGASYFMYDIYSMYLVHLVCDKTVKRLEMSSRNQITNNGTSSPSQFIKVKDYICNQPVMIMHHIFIGVYGFLVIVHLRKNLGDCTFGFMFLMELSTPFVSLRGILSRMNMKYKLIYVVNGIVMIIVFFLCRILVFIYLFYKLSRVLEVSLLQALASLPTLCQISIVILLFPQVYWMYLMLKGAIKLFRK